MKKSKKSRTNSSWFNITLNQLTKSKATIATVAISNAQIVSNAAR